MVAYMENCSSKDLQRRKANIGTVLLLLLLVILVARGVVTGRSHSGVQGGDVCKQTLDALTG